MKKDIWYSKEDYTLYVKVQIQNAVAGAEKNNIILLLRSNSTSFECKDAVRIDFRRNEISQIKRSLSHKHNNQVKKIFYIFIDEIENDILSLKKKYILTEGL